jgi:hypothetical protein
MLQLLLQGQSYEDIGSLLGVDRDEVRSRARAALQEVGGADPDARVGLTDYLLGQADPIGRADAVRHLQNDPEANALAVRLVAQLRLLAPGADLPEIAPARGGRRERPATPPAPSAPAPGAATTGQRKAERPGLGGRISGALGGGGGSDGQARLLIGIGAATLLIVAIVLVLVLGGDDDGGDGGQADTDTATTAAQGSEELTIVALAPVSGTSDASGQAVFATVQDQPVLQLNLNGLQPAGEGQNYIVWLYNSERIAFPLARDQAGQNGALTGAAVIPNEVVPLLGQFGCVDVSLASNKATQAALRQAVEGETLPAHSGETVLRGQIPSSPGEQAPSGAAAQCDLAPAGGAQGGQGGAPNG